MSELFTTSGQRKYLNLQERQAFLVAAENAPANVCSLCHVLVFTGCRLSEALELMPERIDHSEGMIIYRSLKKRDKQHFRGVPVSPALLSMLDLAHGLKKKRLAKTKPLWVWSRTHAYRLVKQVMKEAGIEGTQASPKGLRHSFGVLAVQKGIPLNLLQRWLGHADMATTAIYAEAVGAEEKQLAARLWE